MPGIQVYKDYMRHVIWEERMVQQLSQKEAAELCDMSYHTYYDIESGRSANPSINSILQMCNGLHIFPTKLFQVPAWYEKQHKE